MACYREAASLAEQTSASPEIRARLLGLHGLALLNLGRLDDAVPMLEDAIESGDRKWAVLCGLLDAYWQTGHYRRAMAMIGFDIQLANRVVEHLFELDGACACCGRCCRRVYLLWNGRPIRDMASLSERWRTDPRTRRLQPIRVVHRRSFPGLPVPSESVWEALLAAGYIDAAGATQVAYLQAEGSGLPGLPLLPAEWDRVRASIEEAPVLTADDGDFLFHCRLLGADHRCSDHDHRLPLCREFPTGRTLLHSDCGYRLRLRETVDRIEVPSLFRLAGWYALEHGLHAEFLPHARKFLARRAGEGRPDDLAAIHELAARCCRETGDETAAQAHLASAAALRGAGG
jgi:tetratricopeptide (TPR) repeat protein